MIQRLDTKQMPQFSLESTIDERRQTGAPLDNAYGDNTKLNRDLDRLRVRTNDAVPSIRALADLSAAIPRR